VKQLFRVADNRRPGSLANRFRRRRMGLLISLLEPLPRPVRVLDLGGTEGFWRQMGLAGNGELEILVLNLHREPATAGNIEAAVGDARSMPQFDDGSFDVVFSNSVIEHLRTWPDQERMASEVRRVGVRYFVQTPNRYFPLEPHFLVPGFQFLPLNARIALVRRFALGYHEALPDREDARHAVEEIRLLDARELRRLFPDAGLYRERVLGLTKSFVAYGGWSR
jgi:SAM-dependent methyltransferase